jgi:hypothetical protein
VSDEAVWSLDAIARRLYVADRHTVLAYARRWRDPLRLRNNGGRWWMLGERIDMWRLRQVPGNQCPRVRSLDSIGETIGRSVSTVRRVMTRAHDPLPVEWDELGAWAYKHALFDWHDGQEIPASVALARITNLDGGAQKQRT